MAIEVSLHLHGTPYSELGWAEAPTMDLTPQAIRAYGDRLAERMREVAGVMERLYADGWTSEAQSYELAFTKAGLETREAAEEALGRLGIPLDRDFLTVQEPMRLEGMSSADTYRFYKLIEAQHHGTGTARAGEWVTPSVFAPEMVGMETLLPAARAVVVEHAAGLTAAQFAAEAWRSAHGGPDAPPLSDAFVDVVFEFLASVEDLSVGAEVGLQHEHAHADGHACACEHEP